MAIESARTRLDTKAPAVDLHVTGLLGPLLPPTLPGGRANPAPADSRWTFSADEQVVLALRREFVISNRSPRSVRVEVRGSRLVQLGRPGSDERPEFYREELSSKLDPGGNWAVSMEALKTLKQWAQDYDMLAAGQEPRAAAVAMVDVHDDDDNGTTDSWMLLLVGSPIVPIAGNNAGWQLRPLHDPLVGYFLDGAPTRSRTYFLSRSGGVLLPQPPELERYYQEKDTERRRAHPELFNADGSLKPFGEWPGQSEHTAA